MTREEYIEAAVADIKDKQAKAEIAAEIGAHLDDRIKYYTDAGYDYDYALFQAIGKMGDSQEVSRSMSRLYRSNIGVVSSAYWFMLLGVITMAFNFFALWDRFYFSRSIWSELYGILILIYVMATAIKNSNTKLMRFGLIYQTVIVAAKASMIIHTNFKAAFTGSFLIYISTLLSGDMQAVKAVVSGGFEIIPSNLLFILSVILYLSAYGVIVYVIRFTKKTSDTHYTLRQKHIKDYAFKASIALMLLLLAIFISFSVFELIGIKDSGKEHNRIVIAESDIPCDFSKELTSEMLSDIAYKDKSKIDVNGKSVFLNIFASRNDVENYYNYYYIDTIGGKNTSSYMTEGKIGNLEYRIKNNVLEYTPKHKYVYVFSYPADPDSAGYSFKKEYKKGNWAETDSDNEYVFPVEQGKYPVNINRIKTEKRR